MAEETYQTYINRVVRLTRPSTYGIQLPTLQESPKFQKGKAVPFPGYTITTPTRNDDPHNQSFYQTLILAQQEITHYLPAGSFFAVPPDSFHLTFADLIWEHNYLTAIQEIARFDEKLQEAVAESFQVCSTLIKKQPLNWQLVGLMIRPRAVAVCLVPKDETSYETVLKLRQTLYQNPSVLALGVERPTQFTAHVTLGYFGHLDETWNREQLAELLTKMNDQWLETEPEIMMVDRIELRKFDDMLNYYRQDAWTSLSLS